MLCPCFFQSWRVLLWFAAVLAVGFLLLFVGLAVAVPVLAHSSWHLYRRVVDHAAEV
jgi:uncharacterized membrane protein